jgi:prolyl-tRNA editing enzyme YbaK/EbsC (Cys-tRNA(Pro) deacylase)
MSPDQPLPERSRIVEQHLRAAGLDARIRELPDSTSTAADAAAALGCEIGAIASSLLFLVDDEPLLVMTSGRHRVDTRILAGQVGAYEVELATPAQVRAVTGQAIGGVAPVGHPSPVRTVIGVALAEYAEIWTAAGTPHTVVPMTVEQLARLTDGRRVYVAEE